MRSDNTQLDIFRNRQPTAQDWMTAARRARENPWETPEAAERRARYYEEQAAKAESN